MDDVRAWLAAYSVEPIGALETVHDRPWSTVVRVPTADGDLFLKQEHPMQAYEVPLVGALFERWPDRVPEVVAADTERAWLLLRDAGVNVAESGAVDAFPRALRLYGELQVAEAAHVDDFLAMGLRDLRLSVVTELYEPFFERDHGLERNEVARLLALAPKYRDLCASLKAFHLPASIQHDDLHQWNIFVRGDRVGIYDWGDSSVAFPLWSWLKPLRALGEYGVDPEQARAAYLAPWTHVLSEQRLREALELASPTGQFAYILQIRRQYDVTQAHDEYAAYLPLNLRRLLAQLETA
jgi:Phosphotransferase enzyme family